MAEADLIPSDVVALAVRLAYARYRKGLVDHGRYPPTPGSWKRFKQRWLLSAWQLLAAAMRKAEGSVATAEAMHERFWRDARATLNHELAMATRSPGRPQKWKRTVGLIASARPRMGKKPRGRPRTSIVLSEQEQNAWCRTILTVKVGMHYGRRLSTRGGDPYVDGLVASQQLGRLIAPLRKNRSFMEAAEEESDAVAIEEVTAHLAVPYRDQLRRYLTKHYPRLKKQYPVGR